MSGKTRKNPGVKGKRPDLKAIKRAAKLLAEGSPRSKKKRLAAKKEAAK